MGNINYMEIYERLVSKKDYGSINDVHKDLENMREPARKATALKPVAHELMKNWCKCPSCGKLLYIICDTDKNYCHVCGQKLDWSEHSEKHYQARSDAIEHDIYLRVIERS